MSDYQQPFEEEEDEYVIKVYGKKPKSKKNITSSKQRSSNSSVFNHLLTDSLRHHEKKDPTKNTLVNQNINTPKQSKQPKQENSSSSLKSQRDNTYFNVHINNIIMSSKSVNQYYFDTILRKFNITSLDHVTQIRQKCLVKKDEKILYSFKILKQFFKQIVSSEDKSKFALELSPIIKSAIFNASTEASPYIHERSALNNYRTKYFNNQSYEEDQNDLEEIEDTEGNQTKKNNKKQTNIEKKQNDKKSKYLPDFYDSIIFPNRH